MAPAISVMLLCGFTHFFRSGICTTRLSHSRTHKRNFFFELPIKKVKLKRIYFLTDVYFCRINIPSNDGIKKRRTGKQGKTGRAAWQLLLKKPAQHPIQ